jgi:hypothetical protein
LSKINGIAWKNKAIERGNVIRVLKRQLKETTSSRDSWKNKYQNLQQDRVGLLSKPARHQYPTSLIWLCIYVYNHSHCSFRSCCTMVASCAMLLKISCKKPSASSIRNWVIKSGYYAYMQPPPTATKWCIIIDESVSIGQEKLLLILGIPLDNWQFTKAIEQKDATVLHIGIASSWKSAAIATILTTIANKIPIAYCVSDKGNNIKAKTKHLCC